MSSEIHKYKDTILEKNRNLFYAEIINFPKDKSENDYENLKINNHDFWKINDGSNSDQLKAVTSICFMFGALTVMGLYSSFI